MTEQERKDKEKNPWMYRRPMYNQVPSGRLALRIGSAPSTGIRRTVADSAKHQLEDSLNKFVEVLVLGAEKQQSERLKRERQEREWKERERLRIEEQDRQWKERQKVERLTQQLADWEKSRRIREYIADIQAITLNPEKWNFQGIPLPEWVEWALDYADSIDPAGPIRKACQATISSGGEPETPP